MSLLMSNIFQISTDQQVILRSISKFIEKNNGKMIQQNQNNHLCCVFQFSQILNNNESNIVKLQYLQRQKSYKVVFSVQIPTNDVCGGIQTLLKIAYKLNEKCVEDNSCYQILEPNLFIVKIIIEKQYLIDKRNQINQYFDRLLITINEQFKKALKNIPFIKKINILENNKQKQLHQFLQTFKLTFDSKSQKRKKQVIQYFQIKNQDLANTQIDEKIEKNEIYQQKINKLSQYIKRLSQSRDKRRHKKQFQPLACKIIVKKYEIDNGWKPVASGFGNLQKLNALYTILQSFNISTTQMIQKLNEKNFKEKKRELSNTFVKKNYKKIQQQNKMQNEINFRSFLTQVEVATILRNAETEGIAQYFLQSFKQKQNERKIQSIYTKFYPKCLYEHKMNGKTLFPICILILQGLMTLKQYQILHRDLKPANILLDRTFSLKIIDFGSSCSRNGSINPQKMNQKLYTTQFYNIHYEDMYRSEQSMISKQQFENHEHFDLYAFGKILQTILTDTNLCSQLGMNIVMNLNWLSKKCTYRNPNLRLNCQQAMLICTILFKIYTIRKQNMISIK